MLKGDRQTAGRGLLGMYIYRREYLYLSVSIGTWTWATQTNSTLLTKGAHCLRVQLQGPRREAIAVLSYGAATAAPLPSRLPTATAACRQGRGWWGMLGGAGGEGCWMEQVDGGAGWSRWLEMLGGAGG